MGHDHGYRWTLEQILEEERRLRALAEEQIRAYRNVLFGLAMQLAPHIVDAGRRENPHFPNHLSPQEWQALFSQIDRSPPPAQTTNGWYAQQPEDTAQLERKIQALAAENQHLRQQISSLTAAKEKLERQLQAAEPMATDRDETDAPMVQAPPAISATTWVLPPAPPARFAALFQTWDREGLVLALLASTGWSLRHAIDEAMAERLEIAAGSGSIKRAFNRLEAHGLVSQSVYELGPLKAAILVLTDKGVMVTKAMGIDPAPSEWSILMQAHGGEQQAKHAALCCTFAYQARRRGWTVQICPDVAGPARPDVLLSKEGTSLYVEVEAESGEPERRMRKWRNQAELQGFGALCADTEAVRARLVTEARAAAPDGVATDIASLLQMARKGEDGFWVDTWGIGQQAAAPGGYPRRQAAQKG